MESIKQYHKGPHLGMLAIIFMVLFITGLYFVVSFSPVHYPGPWESADTIATYFRNQSHDVLMCAFFQFGSLMPFGIYVLSVVSRLRFLGVNSAGPYIALFGGFMTVVNASICALLMWVMAYPGIAEDASVIRALYYFSFATGGVGYSVPLGIFFAGVSISAGLSKLIPKWLFIFGMLLAICGVLSFLSLIIPQFVYLIPLTRFPGFIWLIIAGFVLPKTIEKK
jgi:hypothetical protein